MPPDTTHTYTVDDLIAVFIAQALADVPLPPDGLTTYVAPEYRLADWDTKVARYVTSMAIQAAASARAHAVIIGGV